ncbi:MAG TPA: TfoX/Sxy family protein [Polyangia bacterium]|jgi:TfoX/Sxy family transcriptional regulator of competence genes|nr:TfoX/Sxy family protein [Polyangia bacterium]
MATSERTIAFLLDQLRDVRDVSARKMFGEYAIYVRDKVVALVCDDQLFVKLTDAGQALLGARLRTGFAYPGAKASILVAAEDLEDSDRLAELVRVTDAALPAPKPKMKKKSPSTPRSRRN